MELELKKKSLLCYETVLNACTNHEETTDVIVPDSSPDILRILGAFGTVFLKDEVVTENQYSVTGTVSGWVLYVSEGDFSIRRLEVIIPFSHMFESSEIDSEQIGFIEMSLAGLEAREINPRKVTVRANVALCAKTFREIELEFPCEVRDAVDNGVESKTRRMSPYTPIALKKKNVHISEDIEISSAQQAFASMLRYDTQIKTVDTKIIGTKAVVKGDICLSCVYLTKDGEIAKFNRDIPFSQILEIEQLNDDCALEVKLHLSDLKLDPQYDMSGDVHYLALNLSVKLSAIALAQEEFDVIDDLYSVRVPLRVRNTTQKINSKYGRLQKHISVTEKITCETQADEILDVFVCMEPIRMRHEEGESALVNGMQVNVVYRAKDGNLYCASRRVESLCPLPDQTHEYRAVSTLNEATCSIEAMNEILVKLYVDYEIDECLTVEFEVPCCVEMTTEEISEKDCPSVIIRKIAQGETLWKLAKEYRTTIDDIMAANSLESDEILAGDMILIPRRRK